MIINREYKLEILPVAKKDIDDIIHYISNTLKNKTAAANLSINFIKSLNNITAFPYGIPEYTPTSKLTYTYRSAKVKKFLLFYTIDEKSKTITVARGLYQKMNVNKILE